MRYGGIATFRTGGRGAGGAAGRAAVPARKGPANGAEAFAAGRAGARGLAIVAVASLLAACHPPPPDADAGLQVGLVERVSGCWELSPGAGGAEADTVRRWMEDGALPGAIRLDTARAEMGTRDEEFYVAWSYVHSRKQRRPLAAWRPAGGDSIWVETPGALAGTALRLEAGDERLAGTASVFTDVMEPGAPRRPYRAPVEARRAEQCPE